MSPRTGETRMFYDGTRISTRVHHRRNECLHCFRADRWTFRGFRRWFMEKYEESLRRV